MFRSVITSVALVLSGFLVVAAVGIVCGIVGLFFGAQIEGFVNYAEDLTFNRGYPGYEAGGRLGFVVGFVVGCIGASATFVISVFVQKRSRK